jgi:uncharacterized alpha/beta hydrolase family protein
MDEIGDAMKYVIIFLIVVLFCQVIIHWPIRQEERSGVVIWRSSQEKMDIYKSLQKHGQHKQISVIFYDGSKAYSMNENSEKSLSYPSSR